MSRDNFFEALRILMSRRPFRAFTIYLRGGQRFEIDHRRALVSTVNGLTAFFAPGGIPILFDPECVSYIVDAPASDAPNVGH